MNCTKVYFSDESNAEFYIEKLKKTSKRKLKPVRAYLCEKCLNWHLTSIESSENRQLIYKDREIANLKAKVKHLEQEVEGLKKKLVKAGFSGPEPDTILDGVPRKYRV